MQIVYNKENTYNIITKVVGTIYEWNQILLIIFVSLKLHNL